MPSAAALAALEALAVLATLAFAFDSGWWQHDKSCAQTAKVEFLSEIIKYKCYHFATLFTFNFDIEIYTFIGINIPI